MSGCTRHMAGSGTPIFYTTLERFQIAQVADALAIEAAIEESAARFVVIDALADVMSGADENAVKDTQPIFIALRGIAERTQAAIVDRHTTQTRSAKKLSSEKATNGRGSQKGLGAIELRDLTLRCSNLTITDQFLIRQGADVESFKFAGARAVFRR